jgi:hypothetical protein
MHKIFNRLKKDYSGKKFVSTTKHPQNRLGDAHRIQVNTRLRKHRNPLF